MRAGLVPFLLSLFIAIPAAASAETVFTYAPDGGSAITFSLGQLTVFNVNNGIDIGYTLTPSGDFATFDNTALFIGAGEGSIDFEFSDLASGSYKVYEGMQVYSGSELSPIFTPGTYSLTASSFYSGHTGTGTLTIANVANVAPTPEPSSLLLLGTGVAGAIEVARRRRNYAIRYPCAASN